MARVYISSTLMDLGLERAAVKKWLIDSGHAPIESYTPDSQPLLKSCLADIEHCEIYVLILGHRYGSRPRNDNPENLSVTHLEFRHAGARNIPRIVLQRSAIPDVERSDIFDPSEMESIRVFHTEVSNTVRPARFSDVDSLIRVLHAGISNELEKLGRAPDTDLIRDSLRRASRDLISWPTTLPGGTWLERPELELLSQRIGAESSSLTLRKGKGDRFIFSDRTASESKIHLSADHRRSH